MKLNTRTTLILCLLCVSTSILFGCKKRETVTEGLAIVDGRPITVEEFKYEMARRPGDFSKREKREDLLDDILNSELLYAEGLKRGYDKDPEVIRRIKYTIVNKLRREKLEPELNVIKVSDAEIEEYYNENKPEFNIPAKLRAAIIQITIPPNASQEKMDELQKRAEEARRKALELGGETPNFGSVAVEYSDHQQTRYRGGDTGWIEEGRYDQRFDKEIIDKIFDIIEPGQVTPVIETEGGYYIIKLIEKKESSTRPLREVRARIHHQLIIQKREQIEKKFYSELKSSIPVEIFKQKLDTIEAPPKADRPRPPMPPSLPGH